MSLLEVIEEYLRSVGYEQLESDPAYWTLDDYSSADKLIPTVIEVLEFENGRVVP